MPSSDPPPSSPTAEEETWTVGRLLAWTQQRFAQVGIDSPRIDAEHLLSHALGCSRMSLYVDHDKAVNGPERVRFRELVKRRLAREPVAYIEGKRGFHALDLELAVDGRVLIPRPETEHLVDWMLEELPPAGGLVRKGLDDVIEEPAEQDDDARGEEAEASPISEEPRVELLDESEPWVEADASGSDAASEARASSGSGAASEARASSEAEPVEPAPPPPDHRAVLDVGTGSGAIALALKRARPTMRVVACDVSGDALAVARSNAERLELAVELVQSDLLTRVTAPAGGWSAIAANLPYVREPVWRGLAPEVRRFEPRLALDGGEDGLDVIRRLVDEAPRQLAPGGGLYLEIGYDQGESVPALLRARGFVDVELRRDLDGHPRIVRGRRG